MDAVVEQMARRHADAMSALLAATAGSQDALEDLRGDLAAALYRAELAEAERDEARAKLAELGAAVGERR